MTDLLSVVHALSCIFVVIFILLQDPKGGVLGVLGGGGSQSLFGTGGAKNFLVEATKYLSILFVITSISLSYIGSKSKDSLLLDGVKPITTSPQNTESPSKNTESPSKNTESPSDTNKQTEPKSPLSPKSPSKNQ